MKVSSHSPASFILPALLESLCHLSLSPNCLFGEQEMEPGRNMSNLLRALLDTAIQPTLDLPAESANGYLSASGQHSDPWKALIIL